MIKHCEHVVEVAIPELPALFHIGHKLRIAERQEIRSHRLEDSDLVLALS